MFAGCGGGGVWENVSCAELGETTLGISTKLQRVGQPAGAPMWTALGACTDRSSLFQTALVTLKWTTQPSFRLSGDSEDEPGARDCKNTKDTKWDSNFPGAVAANSSPTCFQEWRTSNGSTEILILRWKLRSQWQGTPHMVGILCQLLWPQINGETLGQIVTVKSIGV